MRRIAELGTSRILRIAGTKPLRTRPVGLVHSCIVCVGLVIVVVRD
jgi:hypothetical protein